MSYRYTLKYSWYNYIIIIFLQHLCIYSFRLTLESFFFFFNLTLPWDCCWHYIEFTITGLAYLSWLSGTINHY